MTQMELGITDPAQRRELLTHVTFGNLKNRTVLKALLWMIHSFNGGCFLSQETLAARLDVDDRSIRRAIDHLIEIGILAVELRYSPVVSKTVNHYAISWGDLALFVQRNPRKPKAKKPSKRMTDRTSECPIASTAKCPTTTDRIDRPIGQNRPTDRTLRRTNDLDTSEETTLFSLENKGVSLVGPDAGRRQGEEGDKEQQQAEQPVVVEDESNFEEVATRLVEKLGVFKATEAVAAAKRRGWSPAKCLQLADYAEKLTPRPEPRFVYKWFYDGFPPSDAFLSRTVSRPRLNHHAMRKQRLENQRIAREDGLSLKDELLKLQEAQPCP